MRVPADLSERDLGRFYTLSARDLQIIDRHRRPANRLGFVMWTFAACGPNRE